MNRVAEGFAGWENPFGGQRHLVSLRRADVRCLAFWSKNYRPFLPQLRTLQEQDIPCFFNYTITGLPSVFETHTVPADDAVDSLRELAARFSPDHINWRYDPVILSERTPPEYHLARFAGLAATLQGHVTRCIFSFVWRYSKVERNFAALEQAQEFRIFDPDVPARRALAQELAGIAARHGMTLHSCCGDDLLSPGTLPPVAAAVSAAAARGTRAATQDGGSGDSALPAPIHKAHCLDGETISRLYPGAPCCPAAHPNRPQCGCAENVDIGRYDTCPHGCAYCYANVNKARADTCHRAHDPAAAFLGYTKAESDRFVAEVRAAAEKRKAEKQQLELPLL